MRSSAFGTLISLGSQARKLILPLAIVIVAVLALASAHGGGSTEGRMDRRGVFAILDALALARPNLPRWFIYAMADKESGFSVRAYAGGREDSLGIFQINWNAHGETLEARGIDRARLYDPRLNATYWGEVAERIRRAAISRGYRPPGLWYAIRLRLKGIPWDHFDTPAAHEAVAAFRPFVERWQGRLT